MGGDYRSSWSPPAKDLLSRLELAFVRRFVSPQAVDVLDVGVGNGRILDVLLEGAPSRRVFGVDLAQAMVDVCAARFAGDERVVGLATCDVAAEPLPVDGPFDLITAIRVLKYGAGWADVVASLAGHLSEDGTMVFSMANRRSLNGLSRSYAVEWHATTIGELRALAARLGLTVGAIEGYGRLPFRLSELSRPAWLARLVGVGEVALSAMLGPRLLARELLVALTVHDRRPLKSPARRPVVADCSAATVEKRFLGEPAQAQAAVREEAAALRALQGVVATIPGAACPDRVEALDGPPPTLRMQQVPGMPLLAFFRRTTLRPDWLERFAAVAAAVVTGYVAQTGMPYRDFQFDNMLYHEATNVVGFVDLGAPDAGGAPAPVVSPLEAAPVEAAPVEAAPAVAPLETSLGNLIGSVIFQSARPKWLLRRRQHRHSAQACAAVIDAVVATEGTVLSMDGLQRAARAAYRRCAYRSAVPGLWYATVGFLVATRLNHSGNQFGPVLPAPGQKPGARLPGSTNRK